MHRPETDGTDRRWRVDRSIALLGVMLCVVLIAANLLLLRQNRELKGQLTASESSRFPQVGDQLPELRGMTPAGEPTTVSYGDDARRTLLLVFSPTCGWCQKNLPNWRAIVDAVDPAEFRTIAVATRNEGLAEHLASEPLYRQLPIVTGLDPKSEIAYKLNATPLTLVVSPTGVVEQIWNGALYASSERDAERYFDTEIPGIPDLG